MAFSGQLTAGAIQAIFNSQQPPSPLIQVIDIKKIQAPQQQSQPQNDRYRLVISDGLYFQPAMLATQLNNLVRDGNLANLCVIKLLDYTCNLVQGRKIVIIVNLEIVSSPLDNPIGTPQSIESQGGSQQQQNSNPQQKAAYVPPPQNQTNTGGNTNNMGGNNNFRTQGQPNVNQQPQQSFNRPPPTNQNYGQQQQNNYGNNQNQNQNQNAGANNFGGSQQNRPPPFRDTSAPPAQITPIAELSNFAKGWMIRARVTAKSEIRNWSNPKGTGKLFSVDLLDEQSGEIRATIFQNAVDTLYPLLEVGSVYYISKGQIKLANKKFSSLKNEFEMSLDTSSVVSVCHDNIQVQIPFSFVPISDIQDLPKNDMIDVLGVILTVSDVANITTKNGPTSKRNISILDKTRATIEVSLWGATAENLTLLEGQVVAFKGLRISDYNTKSLTSVSSTYIETNCQRPEAKDLNNWYNTVQGAGGLAVVEVTKKNTAKSDGPRAGNFAGKTDERKMLSQVSQEHLGENQPAYFTTKATITMLKRDKGGPWYNACPGEGCQKKVTFNTVLNQWQCEKCNISAPRCLHRYILSLVAVDHTSSQWLSAFNEAGQKILNIDASKLAEMKEAGRDQEFESYFQKANFKSYIFKIRAKEERYNDVQRVKCSIVELQPVDYVQESRFLLEQIQKLSQR
eukprot:TRINITY_DN3056_c0_g1_i1.p1 TRINITY_DN3056_c0_g1~~TRINITY_DN3056_c0_g1_i1.p1  ORF type:complete len:679 (+),score=164.76 TRINITY_DN3056_c0_g1_i1:54-2090(+)